MRPRAISFFAAIQFIFFLFIFQKTESQCTVPVSLFPYNEGFEITNGGWVTGGTNAWTWGSPAKPVISQAANGVNCWMVGGRTDPFYADGESSWLQSPCFDFSSLLHPVIKFSVFWETEAKFDGASIQYSIDGGASWQNIGAASGDNDCFKQNWFNYSGINYLGGLTGVRDGWSGNIQSQSGSCRGGDGLGRWVTAEHGIPELGGKPNVIIRFIFGAGTQCNAYDGFAVDDVSISEAPAQTASFTYACGGVNEMLFTNTSTPCPTTFLWNFGDDASGVNNTSTAKDPSHTFSAPGSYIVTLTVNNSSTISQTIIINDITTSVTNTTCKLSNGSIVVSPLGGAAPFQYEWAPPVSVSAAASNIKAGNYSVTVTDMNGCAVIKENILVTNTGTPPVVLLGDNTDICPGQQILLNAGDGYKSYLWQDNSTSPTYLVTKPGIYSVSVVNNEDCTGSGSITISPTVNCTDIFFPSSFTPDGNGINDDFGPIGNIRAVSNYHLQIYNRWGQEIFSSTNPYDRWRGDLTAQVANTGTFVWYVQYFFNGISRNKQGVVTIIR